MASNRYAVAQERWDGEDTAVLVDRSLDLRAIVVPGVGSNLISFACPAAGLSFFYQPASRAELIAHPIRYGNPVLLPPNRIWHGRFVFAGRSYALPLNQPPHHSHGLVLDLPWRVVGQGADEAQGAWVRTLMRAAGHPSFRQVFPQDFGLALTFALQDGVLALTAEARNDGPGPFPFCLGFHTYFSLPMAAGADVAGYRLTLPARKRWELDQCFPTGRILSLTQEKTLQSTPASGLRLDDIYTELAPGEPDIRARLWHETLGHGIEMASDRQFPHWVVWTGPEPGSPFICLEPYTCVTNAVNLSLPPEVTGLVALAGGTTWRGRIEFRPLLTPV